jgi:hypothetical protein
MLVLVYIIRYVAFKYKHALNHRFMNDPHPKTAAEVTFQVHRAEDFVPALCEWLNSLKEITSRKELAARVQDAPPLLRSRLKDQGRCDATLAAYADWLCCTAKRNSPAWVHQATRIADAAFTDAGIDLSQTPPEFRQRNIFIIPEHVIHLRRGRPTQSAAHKLANNAARQRRFRQRVKEKLQRLEAFEREMNS